MAGRRGLLGLLGLGLALVAAVVGVQVWSTGDRAPAPELLLPAPSAEPAAPSTRGTTFDPSSAVAGGAADPAPGPGSRRAAGTPRVALSRPELARGRVVEARTGLGVAGVEVTWREGERTTETTSDADGRFELELAPGERASLEVAHPRFVDAVRPLAEVPEGELVLPLVRSATLEVRVDGAWDPATPPEVRVHRVGGSEEEGVSSALTGRLAVFEDLAPGDVHVTVVPAQGAIARTYAPLEIGETTRLGVALEPGATLAGTVQRQGSLAPLPGARVTLTSKDLTPAGAGHRSVTAMTGGDGGFLIEALPPGLSGALVVEAPWGARVERSAAAGMGPVRIRFPAPARLSGVVREASGAGAAGCVVACRLAGAAEALRETEADATGRFDLGEVPGGAKLELTAIRGASWGRALARVPHGGIRSDLELVLAEDLALHGRVVRVDDESPIAGATVRVSSGPRAEREATTAADGSFVLALPAGAARVEVSATGFRTRTSKVRASETAAECVLGLEPAATLAGWVVDGDGWGDPGAHVQARKGKDTRGTTTDARGAFEVDALTPGRWTFESWNERGGKSAPRTIEVVAGVTPEALRLELESFSAATGTVAGEIVVAGSGEPVTGLTFPKGGRVALDGTRFVLYRQPASDRYRLWARGDGVEEISLSNLVLTPGARIEVGRLETRPTSRVRVRLTGAPIRRDAAKVVLRRAEAPAFPWLRVPRQIELEWNRGAWEADGVGRYAWTLQVREGGALRHRERVEVRSRREELTVRLEPPGSGRGR